MKATEEAPRDKAEGNGLQAAESKETAADEAKEESQEKITTTIESKVTTEIELKEAKENEPKDVEVLVTKEIKETTEIKESGTDVEILVTKESTETKQSGTNVEVTKEVTLTKESTEIIELGTKEVKQPLLKKRPAEDVDDAPEAKKPKERKLKFESTYLRSIPSASQYEKSFMHRDIITHVLATETDFIITASIDGHLKFWKKKYAEGVEFVKHFRCHLASFSHLCVNFNGTLLATVCQQDKH
ncbi:unnamed protein product, partial [Cylicostephanus goldi]